MESKKLKTLIELSSSVKIYVPSTVHTSHSVDHLPYVDMVLKELSLMFGGSTSFEALGCWASPVAGLIKEHVTVCQSYCTEKQLSENIDSVVEICERIKKEMDQESVALEINNKLYMV